MQNDIVASLARLSDAELVTQVKALVARERDVTAELIAHLAEMDTRDFHFRAGYPSLYIYCRDALGLSEWEAYNRIEVARAARRFPIILELLAAGSVSLTAVRLLAPHLTADNHHDVLQDARGKRKGQIEEMVASLSPQPDARCSVRRLPAPANLGCAPPAAASVSVVAVASSDAVSESEAALPAPLALLAQTSAPVPPAAVTPLSPDRYKFQVTISGATLEKIRLAKDMIGHAIPSGDDAAILDRAYTALLAELAKKKFAHTPKPRNSHPVEPDGAPMARTSTTGMPPAQNPSMPTVAKPAARTPSAAVKRAVWARDLGRCAFIGTDGHRCNERRFVEFHHVDPYVLGGEATVDGIQLRCRRHNDYEGRLYFGNRRQERGQGRELVPEQVHLSVSRSTRQLLVEDR
jgi:hypothetical protein